MWHFRSAIICVHSYMSPNAHMRALIYEYVTHIWAHIYVHYDLHMTAHIWVVSLHFLGLIYVHSYMSQNAHICVHIYEYKTHIWVHIYVHGNSYTWLIYVCTGQSYVCHAYDRTYMFPALLSYVSNIWSYVAVYDRHVYDYVLVYDTHIWVHRHMTLIYESVFPWDAVYLS